MSKTYRIRAVSQVPSGAVLSDLTDEELSDVADTGLRGQGAVVEMMSRLSRSIQSMDKTTSHYSKVINFSKDYRSW